jgi:arsenate reductase
LLLVLRLFLGLVFIYASWDKILHPAQFAQAVYNYKILPLPMVNIFAIILPWIELIAGAFLILGVFTRGSALIITSLLFIFIIAGVISVSRNLDITCGCFDPAGSRRVGVNLIIEDSALLLVSIWVMITSMKKRKVLFICTHNSARSQMAEGLLNAFLSDRFEACSAGTQPSKINPHAVKAMAEIGIDISSHRSKSLEEFQGKKIDYVVTVCDQAKGACPFFPGAGTYLHQSFDDPSKFQGTNDEILARVREVRDEIRAWIEETFSKK